MREIVEVDRAADLERVDPAQGWPPQAAWPRRLVYADWDVRRQDVDLAAFPPTFLAHCREDNVCPIVESEQLHEELLARGVRTRLLAPPFDPATMLAPHGGSLSLRLMTPPRPPAMAHFILVCYFNLRELAEHLPLASRTLICDVLHMALCQCTTGIEHRTEVLQPMLDFMLEGP